MTPDMHEADQLNKYLINQTDIEWHPCNCTCVKVFVLIMHKKELSLL